MKYSTNLKLKPNVEDKFTSLDIEYEEEHALAWYRMNAHPRPCFTLDLIKKIQASFCDIQEGNSKDVDFVVMASSVSGIFSLGGDLELFKKLIRDKNKSQLAEYAYASIEPLFLLHTGLNKGITTISLVQGDALGAGLETALSTDVLIAEKSAKMGLPEVLFNMFPGMGAYSFLSRKVSISLADKMILGGKLYSASELYDLGVVDILAEDGGGEQAVYDYIKREKRSKNTYRAIRKAKKYCNPVTFNELKKITQVWVDANMELSDKDLRMMDRLVKRQTAKSNIG